MYINITVFILQLPDVWGKQLVWRGDGGNIQLYRNSDNFVHFVWRIFSGFVDRLTRLMPLVEQEQLILPRASGFTPCIQWGSRYSIFSFIRMFCRLLFVLFYFFFWPLCCLFLFDIRILITPLWYLQTLLQRHLSALSRGIQYFICILIASSYVVDCIILSYTDIRYLILSTKE